MRSSSLISASELDALRRTPGAVLICDCGFDLADPAAGDRAYAAGHIPGAVRLDLETQLSGPKTGQNGRHPLPRRVAVAALMAGLGADDDTQVVAYDAAGGMYASRLWWLLRWVGHRQVAVLDGGLPAWQAAGLPLETRTPPAAAPGGFSLRAPLASTISYEQVLANLTAPRPRLVVDARAPDRYRGENETLDPVGGHIPGAVGRFFRANLEADGRFKSAAQLRAEFAELLGAATASEVISQCGSGVTACHNLLAMEVAGLPGAVLYGGSWSEWSSRPGSPIATGEEP